MQLHFTATGNFQGLTSNLQTMNSQVNRTMTGTATAFGKATHPLNQLNRQLETTGRLSAKQFVQFSRQGRSIMQQSKAIENSVGRMYVDGAGNARVMLDVNNRMSRSMVTMADRARFAATMMHGLGRGMIAAGKQIQWAGRQITVGLTVPLLLIGRHAGKAAEEYDRQFTRILKVNNEASQAAMQGAEQFELVSQSIRRQSDALVEYGASMGFVAAESSKMVAELSQMGFAGTSLDTLSQQAMKLSRISGTDLTTSLELARLSAQAFGIELGDLEETFARLNLVENNTALSLDELAQAIPVVGGVAATMGVSIEETAGLLAMMKENGIGANEGATALRTGLLRIVQDATDPAIEAFEKINLNLVEMQERMAEGTDDLEGGDVLIFFDELSKKLKSFEGNQAQMNEFAAAVSKMVGVRSSARFLSFLKEIGDRHDENTTAGRAWIGVMTDAEEAARVYNFENQLIAESASGIAKRLKAELNWELTRLGENFLGVANRAREFAISIIKWFNDMNPAVQRVVLIFAAVVGALGPIAMITGIVTNALGQFLTILTRFLPKFTLWTTAIKAQKLAQEEAALAANKETVAQKKVAKARLLATGAAKKNTTATLAQAAAQSGAAGAAGAAGGGAAAGAGAAAAGAGGAAAAPVGRITKMRIGAQALPAFLGGGKAAAAIGVMAKGAVALVAAFAAVAKFVAIIATALVSIPILANPREFAAGFMETFSGPLERIRSVWSDIQDQVMRLIEVVRSGGEEGPLGDWANILGQIAGVIGGTLANVLSATLSLIRPILDAFEFVFKLIQGIVTLFTDWREGLSIIQEAFKALARVIMGALAAVMDVIAGVLEALEEIPWVGDLGSEALRGWSDELRNAEWAASEMTDEVVRTNRELREWNKTLDQFNDELAESQEFMQGLADAGVDITELTEENVMANEMLTDEMKVQIVAALRRIEMEERINELIAQRAQLESAVERMRRDQNVNAQTLRMTAQAIDEITKQINQTFESSTNVMNDIRDEMEAVRTAAMFADEHMDDFEDSVDDSSDAMDALEKKAEALRDRIRESERAAQEMASALRSGMNEVMNDIVAAVNDELNAQQQRMDDQFDARVQAIEDTADADLQRIDDQQKREEELERKRKRWFEQEKARIEYLKGMEQGNVQMQEALARGDVSDAAIIKIGLQSDAERFMLDSYEREAEAYKENRRDEIQSKQDAIDETRKLAIAQIEMEREAAQKGYEARREAVQRYLRDWQRVTPATEAEFRRHLGALTGNLNSFGVNMANVTSRYTDIAGGSIIRGFARATDLAAQAVAESDKWKRVGEASGERFRLGLARELAKVESDLDALRSGKNVNINSSGLGSPTRVGTPSFTSNITPIQTGWQAGTDWSTGANQSMSAADFAPNPLVSGQRATGGSMLAMHTGGKIDTTPNMPGLRPDEQAYVLQRGEFVVQKDAVNALGPGYLEMLNQMKKHDGGLINFAGSTITEGNILGGMAGFGLGSLATLAAADIVEAGGGNARQESLNTDVAGGRTIGKSAGEQISDVLSKFMAFSMEGDSAGWRPSSSGWPRRRWATMSPNTSAARQYWRSRGNFPGGIGDDVHRGVESSDHSWGKALDFMVAPLGRFAQGAQKQLGWAVANWHLQNPNAFGTKYVIWDKLINSGDSRGWRNYGRYGPNPGATLGHYDHVHVSYMHDGGMVPSLRTGGKIKFDNTLANLHKGERVLTEPSTKALEAAIQNFAGGMGTGGDTYEINIEIDGTGLDENKLASKIMDKIELQEVRKGRKRVQR